MTRFTRPFTAIIAAATLTLALTSPAYAEDDIHYDKHKRAPIVIGHRGASGYIPEHTLAAYFLAIEQGADFIEPDLVSTKDGVLVARHENEIGSTTDVADRAEFADRKKARSIDGIELTGWFTEDFTLEELKTLRVKERIPQVRPGNARLDGSLKIPTLKEILELIDSVNEKRRKLAEGPDKRKVKAIGIYPETKHPTYFAGIGLALEEPLVDLLHTYGYIGRRAPVFIQSFETGNLKKLAGLTKLPLVQLLSDTGKPYDFVVSGDARTYADLSQPQGLREIARYADGVGPSKNQIIPRNADGTLGAATTLVRDAHQAGLLVHPYTFRAENFFLPAELRSNAGADPTAFGNLEAEVKRFLELGMDGFFTDHPDIGKDARDEFIGR